MGSITRYAAINSKLKAMERSFLSGEQSRKILQCTSIEEVVNYIKNNTLYGEAINNYLFEEITEENVEYALMKNYIDKFHSIYSFFNGEYKKLFNVMFMKHQFEDLRAVIRGKYTGRKCTNLNELISYHSPLNKISFERIISSRNVSEAMNIFKHSRYYKYLDGNLNIEKDEDLFRLEISLDYAYYTELMKIAERLGNEDKAIINCMIGTEIDLLNIQFIYRAKKYYNMSSEETLNETIPYGYKIHTQKLKELCYYKTIEDFNNMLRETKYKDLFKYGQEEDYLVQRDVLAYTRKINLKYKKEHKNNIGTIISYLQLALGEIRDLISIIEAKRYCINEEELINYISFNID